MFWVKGLSDDLDWSREHPTQKKDDTMKKMIAMLTLAFGLATGSAWAHCQVPCGIFTDDIRFSAMLEDVTTIEKSIKMIEAESAKDKPNYNQLVRWVKTKEEHADKISKTVLVYFLQQRVKPTQDNYKEKLVALHNITIHAMKTKQSLDLKNTAELKKAIETFKKMYHKH